MPETYHSRKAGSYLIKQLEEGEIDVFDLDMDERSGATDCPHECVVEVDGICPHGWKSGLFVMANVRFS